MISSHDDTDAAWQDRYQCLMKEVNVLRTTYVTLQARHTTDLAMHTARETDLINTIKRMRDQWRQTLTSLRQISDQHETEHSQLANELLETRKHYEALKQTYLRENEQQETTIALLKKHINHASNITESGVSADTILQISRAELQLQQQFTALTEQHATQTQELLHTRQSLLQAERTHIKIRRILSPTLVIGFTIYLGIQHVNATLPALIQTFVALSICILAAEWIEKTFSASAKITKTHSNTSTAQPSDNTYAQLLVRLQHHSQHRAILNHTIEQALDEYAPKLEHIATAPTSKTPATQFTQRYRR